MHRFLFVRNILMFYCHFIKYIVDLFESRQYNINKHAGNLSVHLLRFTGGKKWL